MFKIGEFSKIAQTPISQLRYYDQIGLFQPSHTDAFTGYRYYSVQQLPRLNRILALKDLGFSLEQISRAVEDEISAEEVKGMLALRKSQIEQSLEEELLRLRAVEARLTLIEGQPDDAIEVELESTPEQFYLACREVFASPYDALGLMQELMAASKRARRPDLSKGVIAVVLHNDSFTLENMDCDMGLLLDSEPEPLELPSGRRLDTRQLPAVDQMLSSMRVGPFENSCKTYGALGTWIEERHYEVCGPVREIFVVPPRPGHEHETAVKVQFPVSVAT